MITFRITTHVKDDRRVVLMLPPEVPTGEADLIVTVECPAAEDKRPGTGLSDGAEPQAQRDDPEREKARAAALDQFLALARSSSFRSTCPYPTRDELHERHRQPFPG